MSRKAAEHCGVKPEAEGHVPSCFDGKWNLDDVGTSANVDGTVCRPRGLSPVL
ncbi:BQ5605_C003g02150 [Microbotryum silenes-dioicae]|uniref:BQ5605_C003g02150 protein n=1 Tax=Microbotryum silenes-dioicae TaxID=796604 RepID=A0A2X0P3G3_9BASI|nr:BQ5605_C003g02150 [Microbotryum silenes-dioicae]